MIEINNLLSSDRILCKCELKSKKRSLQTLAELLAPQLDDVEVSEMDILDALINREKLGSTGLGHGVALPHGRITNLPQPMAAIITLEEGVDFDAPDENVVDLMIGLIVPENCAEEHLSILASLAQLFSQRDLRQALRKITEPVNAFTLLTQNSASESLAPITSNSATNDSGRAAPPTGADNNNLLNEEQHRSGASKSAAGGKASS